MDSFKLYIHAKPLPKQCGVMRFLNRLILEMKKQNYKITTDFSEPGITHALCIIFNEDFLKTCKDKGIKIISRFSEVNIHYYDRLKFAYENSDKIIFQSEYNYIDFSFEFGYRNIPQRIIINGIDYNEFPKIDINKKKTIFSLGAFHKRENGAHVKKVKALKFCLDALVPLFEKDPEWKYYIVGPGSHHEDLKNYLEIPCFKNRLFYIKNNKSFVSNDNIFKIANNCSIYLHTVMYDSCPNSLIEAISMWFPIAYFDYGSLNSLFYKEKELVSPMNSTPKSIRMAIEKCYRDFEDYNESSLYLAKTKFNIENTVKNYVDFLEE